MGRRSSEKKILGGYVCEIASLLMRTIQQNFRDRAPSEARVGGLLIQKWRAGHRRVERQAIRRRRGSTSTRMQGHSTWQRQEEEIPF